MNRKRGKREEGENGEKAKGKRGRGKRGNGMGGKRWVRATTGKKVKGKEWGCIQI